MRDKGQESSQPLIGIGIDLDWPLPNHYELLRGILHRAKALGWRYRVVPVLETTQTIDALPDRYDGVIARASSAVAHCCREFSVPLVNVWANCPYDDVSTVVADYEKLGRAAAQHLIQRGFRNLGFVGPSGLGTVLDTLHGVREAMGRYADNCAVLLCALPTELAEWEALRLETRAWLSDLTLPAGIVVSDHTAARNFACLCEDQGLSIPEDVAIVSCRESDLVCGGIEPGLTSIHSNFEVVGRVAADMLAQLLAGGTPGKMRHLVETEALLIERMSTDVRSVDDPVVASALRHIRDHSHLSISVAQVAAAVNVHRRSLERRFRQTIDQTVKDAITETRLRRAQRLLADTDEPIKAVANASGFGGSTQMAQVFRRILGTTPSAYRVKCRRIRDLK